MNQPSLRNRFLIGLVVAAAIGAGVEYLLLNRELESGNVVLQQRVAIVMLQSLASTVERAASTEDGIRVAVAEFAKQHPEVNNIRVVKGARLEASTSPQDSGDKAAPRRLAREEKPLFDQGQRLRAAVQTNREEGVSRKEEIEIVYGDKNNVSLSTPIEEADSVIGFVQTNRNETKTAGAKANPLAPLMGIAIAVVLFLLLSAFIPKQIIPLAILSTLLLAGVVAGYGHYSRKTLEADLEAQNQTVAAQIAKEGSLATTALGMLSINIDPPLQPSNWDADVFRRPRQIVMPDGKLNYQKIAAAKTQNISDLAQAVIVIGLFSLAVLAFFGSGMAHRFLSALIEYRAAYAYILPAMVGMLVLVFFPFLYGITLSFTGSSLYNSDKTIPQLWVGLENYKNILFDFSLAKHTADGWLFNYSNFYWTFLFTVFWTVTNVTIGVSLGLILALMLNTKGLALRPIYRVLLIFPWAMPNYITALIWKGMFHQQFGVINQVLQIFGARAISWFESPFSSFLTALATNGWLSFPFMMVVSLGALQSIPGDLYEAARVDGATRWQQFRSITLPSLKPSLIPAIILSVVWTFNMFNIIYLVTQGEPAGSTEILVTESYKIAFEKYRYGYAAAYSTVIFLILLVYGTIQNRVTRATEAIAG